MVIVAVDVSPLRTVVELEFLTPENSSLPSVRNVEAFLHRLADDCGREFSPHGVLVNTDQRRCKAKFELDQ
jgi:hypothetical protein